MNRPVSHRLILVLALVAALLWTLMLAAAYALLAATDDASRWLNQWLQLDPGWEQWLTGAAVWLADVGVWVLLVVWGLGIAFLALAAGFARRVAKFFLGNRHEGQAA